jgi:hypothetical protein
MNAESARQEARRVLRLTDRWTPLTARGFSRFSARRAA